MTSFEEILDKKATDIKAPPAYPVGTYHCIIDGPPTPGKSSQKGTPFLEFKFKIMQPQADVDATAAAEMQLVGKYITGRAATYYITDASTYMLKEMLVEHCGIEEGDKTLKELIAEAPGRQLLVNLRHEASQDGKRVFHQLAFTAKV